MKLKYQIYDDRKDPLSPICPICERDFSQNAPSMHEVFIPRGVAKGCSVEAQTKIFVPQNVVLIHEPQCHVYAQHYEEGKIKCALQIIKFEGYENTLQWMKDFDTLVKTIDNQKYTILESAYEIYKRESGIHVKDINHDWRW